MKFILYIKNWWLIAFFALNVENTIAQSRFIDSLKQVIKEAKHDTVRLLATVNLSKGFYNFYPDTVVPMCKEVIRQIDAKLPNEDLDAARSYMSTKALALSNIGFISVNKGDYEEAFGVWEESIKLREQIQDKKGVGILLNNMSYVYGQMGDKANGIKYSMKALKIFEEIKDSRHIALSLHSLATAYSDLGDNVKAMDYYNKNLIVQKKIDDNQGLGHTYASIGGVYCDYCDEKCAEVDKKCKLDYLNKAMENYELSYIHMEKAGAMQGGADALIAMGDVIELKEDLNLKKDGKKPKIIHRKESLEHYQEALSLSKQVNYLGGIAKSLIRIGECHFDQNNLSEALIYFEKAMENVKKLKSPNLMEVLAYQMFKLYETQGKYKEAFEMQELYIEMKDSLKNEVSQKAILEAEIKYNYEKKTLADSLKLIQDKAVYALQIENQRKQKTFIGIIAGLILIFAAFIFNRFKQSQKQNLIIENANKDLARQHILNQKIFSTISHDFRGPILSLKYVLESFKNKKHDSEINDFFQTLGQELNTSTEMLNNLLNWAKTEIGLKDFESTTANVSPVFLDIERELKQKIESKNLSLNVEISENGQMNLPPDILKIALRNLLSNAIKFSYMGGKIEIKFDEKNNSILVKDDGKGMSQATLQKLFKQEVDTELGTANEEGFGMGLYIISELLHKYHFKIHVESKEEQGACFKIMPVK